jgi:peptidoglycan/LPS O-acetylase OafA/YrhL
MDFLQFRTDINGLRAIAVIAVVLYHCNSSWIPGGFAGVDVFFVISGFFMTEIIFSRIEQNNFSVLKFYLARAKRIIPPLAFLCLVLLVFGWFFELDVVFETMSKHILSSLTFISNITYWTESGYFDAGSHEKWLLHTWSLSTEWQFYIIYPLVVLTMRMFMSIKAMKLSVLTGTVVGFIFCVIITYKWPDPAYYLLPTRAWEMMIGGVAYLYPIVLKEKRKKLLEWFGLSLILITYFFISKENLWPGYLSILPTLGACFILQAKRNDSFITNNIAFQKIGSWSYSIYLWHWPLVIYMYTYMTINILNTSLVISLSIILGMLSYKFTERRVSGKNTIIVFLVTLGLSSIVYINNGVFDVRNKSQDISNNILNTYKNYIMDPTGLFTKCNASLQVREKGSPEVHKDCLSSGEGGIFLWGDSHLGSLSTGIRSEIDKSIPFSQLTSSGCEPSFTMRRNGSNRSDIGCDYSNDLAYNAILNNKPSIVILGASSKHETIDWDSTITKLHEMGVRKVVIIGPLPQWQPSLPLIYVKRHMGEEYISDFAFAQSILIGNDYLIDLQSKNDDFVFINIIDNLCIVNETDKLSCKVKVDETLMSFDYGHLTVEASKYVAKSYILPFL